MDAGLYFCRSIVKYTYTGAFRSTQPNLMKRILLLLALINAFVTVFAQTPDATGIIYVKMGSSGSGTSWADAYPDLADALNSANVLNNATPGKVKQVWVAAGTYYPKFFLACGDARCVTLSLVKDVAVYGGFAGTEAAIEERDMTANISILSGDFNKNSNTADNAYHVVTALGDLGTALLDGFTISGGRANGGGIYVVNDQTLITSSGAGLYLSATSELSLSNLIVTDNYAAGAGAGIFSIRKCYLSRSVLKNNSADASGGGACFEGGEFRLDQVNILNNTAAGNGGGLYINLGIGNISNMVVKGNAATIGGGGMTISNTGINLSNVQVTGNVTPANGGGICLNGSGGPASQFTNVTLSANVAGNGGGIYADGSAFILNNSIVYGNSAPTGAGIYEVDSDLYTGEYNLVEGRDADSTRHTLAGVINPQFKDMPAAAQTTGGDFTLTLGNPVSNKGSNALYSGLDTATKDLAGNPRLFGAVIDLGAYEMQVINTHPDSSGILYVKKGATGNGSSWENALGDLAPAMRDAGIINSLGIDSVKRIWVTADKYYPMDGITGTGSNASFVPVKDVAVYGGFLGNETTQDARDLNNNLTVLSGNIGLENDNNDNAYHVLICSGDLGTATMDGFIINAGNASTLSTNDVNGYVIDNTKGGGLYVVNSHITFSHLYVNLNIANTGGGVFVTGNSVLSLQTGGVSSNAGTGGHGGGILVDDGAEARFTNAIFNSNSGGAILTKTGGLMTLTNSFVRGNSSTSSEPGVTGYAKLTNVQVTGNSHTGGNGPVLYLDANSSVINCTVSGNNTGNAAGAAVWANGSIMMSNTVVYGNANKAVNDIAGIIGANNILDGNVDPGFNNMRAYTTAPFTGGDYSLKTSSTLIDAGDNSSYPGLDGDSRDLAGNARVAYLGSGGIIDIGAYEFPVQTIRGNDMTKTYGDADFDPGFTASSGLPVSFESADTTIASVVNDLIHIKKAGVVNIIATQVGDIGNSPAPSRTFVLTINKAVLTVTTFDTSKVYNDTAFVGGNGFTISGFVLDDPYAVVNGFVTYGGTSQGAVNVGEYTIELGGLTAENYIYNYLPGTLTITAAPLIVRANNDSVFYSGNAYTGGNDVTYAGLVNGQTSSVLTGTLSYTGTSQGAVQSGAYVITPGGLTASNYDITFEDGALVIMKDTLRVIAADDAHDYNGIAYNGGNGVTYAGFVNNEDATVLTGALVYQGDAQGAVNAGTYTIIPAGVSNANYVIEFVAGELVINRLPLTVTADDHQRCYGDADPLFTFTSTGFITGEDFTTAPTGSSNTNAASAAGDYEISFSAGVADNYVISYVTGTLTIKPAPALTLSTTGEYLCGTTAPVLTVTGGAGYTWLRDDVVVNAGADATMNATAGGVYVVTSTDAIGCTGKSEAITIVAVAAPVLTFATNNACIGTPVTVSNNSAAADVDYTWSAGEQSSTAPSPSFTFTTPGEYVVTGIATSRVCPALTTTVTSSVHILAPEPGVTLPAIQAIIDERMQLNARELAGASYKWTPATGLSDDEVANPTTVLAESQTYYINMSFASGCVTTDTLLVTASHKPNLVAANAFTPNGDGRNDYLHVKPRDLSYVNYFKVYDRLGNLLFTSKDPADGWDGTFNGKQMKTDTYIWMAVGVDFNGKIVKRQGTVTLIR
jgi:gliding motility-associated-like protein